MGEYFIFFNDTILLLQQYFLFTRWIVICDEAYFGINCARRINYSFLAKKKKDILGWIKTRYHYEVLFFPHEKNTFISLISQQQSAFLESSKKKSQTNYWKAVQLQHHKGKFVVVVPAHELICMLLELFIKASQSVLFITERAPTQSGINVSERAHNDVTARTKSPPAALMLPPARPTRSSALLTNAGGPNWQHAALSEGTPLSRSLFFFF